MDVRQMMLALGDLHHSSCYLEVAADGLAQGPGLVLRALLVSNAPGSDLKNCELGLSREWPNRDGRTVEGQVMELLYKLDYLATEKWWKQGELVLP
jgi:hypothetical protein